MYTWFDYIIGGSGGGARGYPSYPGKETMSPKYDFK